MGSELPRPVTAALDETIRAAREAATQLRLRYGPLDLDDPLDAALARLLRCVAQLEADAA